MTTTTGHKEMDENNEENKHSTDDPADETYATQRKDIKGK